MTLEDYFEFEKVETQFGPAEHIRIKGHRISIEHVTDCFNAGMPPDRIQRDYYPSLTLEEVYATITYYLHNKEAVDAYIARGRKVEEAFYQEWRRQEPSPLTLKLRELKSAHEKEAGTPP